MGVNGIYGLSGSGLDVESMVKVGMLSKQAEYDKMQQKYTKDEWKKTEFLSLYGEIQTFNASTLSKYKMSSSMNSRDASSADSSTVTATANSNAATMTHYVEVTGLASSAYFIGTTSPERENTDASEKTKLASVLFSSIEAVDGDSNKVKVDGVEKNADSVAFEFSIDDGVNGLVTSSDSDVVVASASPNSASGTYKVVINSLATVESATATSTGNLQSGFTSTSSVADLFSGSTNYSIINGSHLSSGQYETDTKDLGNATTMIANNSTSTDTALAFTFNDETNSKTINLSYANLNLSAEDFVTELNEKFNDTTNGAAKLTLKAEYVTDSDGKGGFKITNTNGKLGTESNWSITNVEVDDNALTEPVSEYKTGNWWSPTTVAEHGENYGLGKTAAAGYFANQLFFGSSSGISDSATSVNKTVTGEVANVTVTDQNGNAVSVTPKLEKVTNENGTTSYVNTATTADGMTFTLKNVTDSAGVEITNEGTQNVSVTYRELLDGFSFYDLTSKINTMNSNVRMNYDSVQDRFSLYNKKSGEKNQINIQIGTGEAAENAVKFFNKLDLKQSSHGTISKDALTFAAGKSVSQGGVNASAKVDGVEYNALDSNNVSVDGVTYTFQNLTATDKNVAVTVTQDTETIMKNVQSFVDDYNALLTKLYKWYDEKPNSDYKPLTSLQKEGMKEEQIEKWEEKAKAGMLYHDKTLGKVITELRAAVSENVDGVNGKYKNVFSIGISTTGLKGQLTLDKDKLKAALAEDPDAVYNVFAKLDNGEKQYLLQDSSGKQFWSTNASQSGCTAVTDIEDGKAVTKTVERSSFNGIAQRLGDAFMASMKNIKNVSGTTASITEDSELNNLMRELQTKMSNFKRMMQAFETRLYKKYDAMESSLALLGSQLNYVTSAFQ